MDDASFEEAARRAFERGLPADDVAALSALWNRLRSYARKRLVGLPPDFTLRSDDVAAETILKLATTETRLPSDPQHLVQVALRAASQVVADRLRSRGRRGRKGPADAVERAAQVPEFSAWLDARSALDELARTDPDAAQVGRLRLFGGLSIPEIVVVLRNADKPAARATVERRWSRAKAKLVSALGGVARRTAGEAT